MKTPPSPIAALVVALCLCACSRNGDGTGPVVTDPLPSGGAVHNFSYTLQGNSMILSPEYQIRFCIGDSLSVNMSPRATVTIEFELDGNTWRHLTVQDTLNSGAVIRWMQIFNREGSGTGLEGVWVRIGGSFRVLSGTPEAAEKMRMDSVTQARTISMAYHEYRITLTRARFSQYTDVKFAAQFVDYWNGTIGANRTPDSAVYDIALRIVDKYTVELRGLKNHETVNFSFFPQL